MKIKLSLIFLLLMIIISNFRFLKTYGEANEILPETREKSSTRYALLIGIEDYPGTGLDLDYCLDDVYDMYNLLIDFCNFPSANIKILEDENATRANIQAGIEWLAENASDNDLVVFFYSGHGSWGGKLAQYDHSSQGGISSYELDAWLDNISSKLLVVIDCCFAGAFVTKGVKCVPEPVPKQASFPFVKGIEQENRTILMACDSDEKSWEFDELQNGVFTYYLVEGLRSLEADSNKDDVISVEEAFNYTKPKVENYTLINAGAKQTPQINDWISGEVDVIFVTTGDIHIDDMIIKNNELLLLRGNLTVAPTGSLSLYNSSLMLLPNIDGEFYIKVDSGAELNIYSSKITSWHYNKHYLFSIQENANFRMENSTLLYCGYNRSERGLLIEKSNNIKIKGSIFSDNFFGITFNSSSNISIESCNIFHNNDYGILLVNCTNVSVTNSKIIDDEIGICLDECSNVSIYNSTLSKNNYGIWTFNSTYNEILYTNISENYYDGLRLYDSSTNNKIINCRISNNPGYGIYIRNSSRNNRIMNCNLHDNGRGLLLWQSSNNILRNNTLLNNEYNFGVCGEAQVDYYQDIDISNTINLLPIHYVISCSDQIYNGSIMGIGYLGIVACKNISIRNVNMSKSFQGLLIVNTTNSTIALSAFYNNLNGVYLARSSTYNLITDCDIYDNPYGISFYNSSNNNKIFHNNFINNAHQAYDECSNFWDNGIEGNYWSDYIAEDADADGIGDVAYNITGGNNKDNYPLIEPIGVDTLAPKIMIEGVVNGGYYNITITPIIHIFDLNLNTSMITLNDEPFVSGTPIISEGAHTLYVQATDKANNAANDTVTFTIDKTEPSITIINITDNSYYNFNVTPVIDFYDNNLNFTSIQLNGNNFTSGTTIGVERSYTLVIQATDKAGNRAQKIISFIIDKTPPELYELNPRGSIKTAKEELTIFGRTELGAQVKINGELVELSADGTFSKSVSLNIGKNQIAIEVSDLAGNTYSEIITVVREEVKFRYVELIAYISALLAVVIVSSAYLLHRRRKRMIK